MYEVGFDVGFDVLDAASANPGNPESESQSRSCDLMRL